MKKTIALLLALLLASGILCCAAEENQADEDYLAALEYLGQERYYSAWEAFRRSGAADAAERAEECLQPWPSSGEIWRAEDVKGGDMQITIEVEQDGDYGFLARFFSDGRMVSCLFVKGSGSATVTLPGGVYTIMDGTGSKWFGVRDAFGRSGSYESMTFDEEGTEEVFLEGGYAYTIVINVVDIDPEGEGIGSEEEDWETFAQCGVMPE